MRLTEKGREESRLLGRQLRNVPLDLCIVTSFGRTRETAEIALEQRQVPVEVDPLDVYRAWKRAHLRSEPFPGGESLDAAAARYRRALESLSPARSERSSSSRTRSRCGMR